MPPWVCFIFCLLFSYIVMVILHPMSNLQSLGPTYTLTPFKHLKFVFQHPRPSAQQKQNFLIAPINSNMSLANTVQGRMLLSIGELVRLERCLENGGNILFNYTIWFKWREQPNSRNSKPELSIQEEGRAVLSIGSEKSGTGFVFSEWYDQSKIHKVPDKRGKSLASCVSGNV